MTEKKPILKLKLGSTPKLDKVQEILKPKVNRQEYVPIKKATPSKRQGNKKSSRPPQITRDTKISRSKHFVSIDEFRKILKGLSKSHSKAFPPPSKPPVALGIGIHKEIAELLEITNQKAYFFCRIYCGNKRYKEAVSKSGAPRYNLKGKKVGTVD